ncbi:MAG: hypothetical protein K8R67_16980 [Desulfobacteraceae bacterium]|nr:hypothetical protein [Desulfobacteraceae bacterium]
MKELRIGGFDHEDNKSVVSEHNKEINTLRIDKLSNRITIISIIIPCIIGAILIFGYFDMQETVIDVNNEKQTKILEITKQFEKRTNALDVQLAKIQSMLETTLPGINKKITKLEGSLAKLSSQKADKKKTGKDIAKLNSVTSKNKTALGKTEKEIKKNQSLINDTKTKLETNIADIDKKLNAESLLISEYENSVATTSKNLSILEKRYNEFKKNALTNQTLDNKLDKMNQTINTKLDKLEQKITTTSKKAQSNPVEKKVTPKKKAPETPPKDEPIVEEVLKE